MAGHLLAAEMRNLHTSATGWHQPSLHRSSSRLVLAAEEESEHIVHEVRSCWDTVLQPADAAPHRSMSFVQMVALVCFEA